MNSKKNFRLLVSNGNDYLINILLILYYNYIILHTLKNLKIGNKTLINKYNQESLQRDKNICDCYLNINLEVLTRYFKTYIVTYINVFSFIVK